MCEICSGDCLTCNACDHRMYMYVNVLLEFFLSNMQCMWCERWRPQVWHSTWQACARVSCSLDTLMSKSLAHQILWCQRVLHTRYLNIKVSCTPDTLVSKFHNRPDTLVSKWHNRTERPKTNKRFAWYALLNNCSGFGKGTIFIKTAIFEI